MKKKLSLLMILLCGVFLVDCATEREATQPTDIPQDKCDVPIWNVGDTWRYMRRNKREFELKVLGIEEYKNTKIYIVEDVYGPYKLGIDIKTFQTKVYIYPDGKKETTEGGLYYDFPLYISKKWTKRRGVSGGEVIPSDYTFIYKVVSFETINVPAGTFKAFKIERTQIGRSRGYVIRYIWYAPEVKREIKEQYGPISGTWTGIDEQAECELKMFRSKDKSYSEVTSIVVTGTSANIYSGAGNEFPFLTTVKQGDKLILIGESKDWFNVRLENGQEGWINKIFVK